MTTATQVQEVTPYLTHEDADALIDFISAAFRMRRKKLVNNLTTFLDRHTALAAMGRAKIDANARAEELSLDDFARLQRLLG